MTTIQANLTEMFSHRSPWDCSNSVANLGPRAAELTGQCAMEVAAGADKWLLSDRAEACEGVRAWAADTGAWDASERDGWSEQECLALFVQNVASELRNLLDSDNQYLPGCVTVYAETDWENSSESPLGSYSLDHNGQVTVEYYTGC